MSPTGAGVLTGVGVGPGDPELLTLKAARTIEQAQVLCYVQIPGREPLARQIAAAHIPPDCEELPLPIPMSHDRTRAGVAYRAGAATIRERLTAGRRVVALCQGDPLFYGSFIHLQDTVGPGFPCRVIPGIISPTGAAASALRPLSRLSDRVAIVNARNDDHSIRDALAGFDSVAILKAGPSRGRLLGLIREAGRWHETVYLAQVGTAQEAIIPNLDDCPDTPGPYFSLFLTTRPAS